MSLASNVFGFIISNGWSNRLREINSRRYTVPFWSRRQERTVLCVFSSGVEGPFLFILFIVISSGSHERKTRRAAVMSLLFETSKARGNRIRDETFLKTDKKKRLWRTPLGFAANTNFFSGSLEWMQQRIWTEIGLRTVRSVRFLGAGATNDRILRTFRVWFERVFPGKR